MPLPVVYLVPRSIKDFLFAFFLCHLRTQCAKYINFNLQQIKKNDTVQPQEMKQCAHTLLQADVPALIHIVQHPNLKPKINQSFEGVPMFILGLAELKLGLRPRIFHTLTLLTGG